MHNTTTLSTVNLWKILDMYVFDYDDSTMTHCLWIGVSLQLRQACNHLLDPLIRACDRV